MRVYLTLWLLVGACARDDGRWPSLKPRPAELRDLRAIQDGAPPDGTVRASSTSTPIVKPSTIISRLTDCETNFANVRRGLSVEQAAMRSALAAAQGSPRNRDAWAAAQLQLTRVDVVAAQLDDLQPDVGQLARDAEGADAATLARVRALTAGLDSERATLSRLTQAARDALAR